MAPLYMGGASHAFLLGVNPREKETAAGHRQHTVKLVSDNYDIERKVPWMAKP